MTTKSTHTLTSQPGNSQKIERLRNLTIDFERGVVRVESLSGTKEHKLDTPEGFALVGQAWLRAGWDAKYVYSFTWMGRPIIQLPDDALRMQELVYRVKPDVIIETGIAHGGSLIFYASLCKMIGKGRVIGVDVEIRSHNRKAIEEHELFPYLALVEGDSVSEKIVDQIASMIKPKESVLVILDSCHTKEHVLKELAAYSRFVTPGSYIVAMDGIKEIVVGAPRTTSDWDWDNPRRAAMEFVEGNPEFVIEQPSFLFNEGAVDTWVSYSPSGVIKRLR